MIGSFSQSSKGTVSVYKFPIENGNPEVTLNGQFGHSSGTEATFYSVTWAPKSNSKILALTTNNIKKHSLNFDGYYLGVFEANSGQELERVTDIPSLPSFCDIVIENAFGNKLLILNADSAGKATLLDIFN